MLAKLKALLVSVKNEIYDIWNRIKIPLIMIGGLIVALEFKKLQEYFLVKGGQKQITNAKKEDANLAAVEKTDSDAADALVQEAKDLPAQQPPVTQDWYKKEDSE
jgi:hypothetical protein